MNVSYFSLLHEPPYDSLLFISLASAYVQYLAVRYVPTNSKEPPLYSSRKVFRRYVSLAGWLGLFVPLAYIIAPLLFHRPSFPWALFTAGPHVLLLISQVVSERFFNRKGYSLPIRALVPSLYNARRMFTLHRWIVEQSVALSAALKAEASTSTAFKLWLLVGLILAGANYLFWAYNLFLFLIPIYIPDALRVHTKLHPNAPREEFVTFHEDIVKKGAASFPVQKTEFRQD